jgi:uncharacterized protein YjbI with pentapeptide repeats
MIDFNELLEKHALWLKNDPNGERADLRCANLRGIIFRGANLSGANLSGASLRDADLVYTNLRNTNLVYTNLRNANLSCANLSGSYLIDADLSASNLSSANLSGANLSGANLLNTILTGANLIDADLQCTDLRGADFPGANLKNTCLDPANIPNQKNIELFESSDGKVIGYRTRRSNCCGGTNYEDGKSYSAPVFSTGNTECHPGLYMFPTLARLEKYIKSYRLTGEKIKVLIDPKDIHRVGDKWRCRAFTVIGAIN